jgi:hypothetical protein
VLAVSAVPAGCDVAGFVWSGGVLGVVLGAVPFGDVAAFGFVLDGLWLADPGAFWSTADPPGVVVSVAFGLLLDALGFVAVLFAPL